MQLHIENLAKNWDTYIRYACEGVIALLSDSRKTNTNCPHYTRCQSNVGCVSVICFVFYLIRSESIFIRPSGWQGKLSRHLL